jgi:serine protease Do
LTRDSIATLKIWDPQPARIVDGSLRRHMGVAALVVLIVWSTVAVARTAPDSFANLAQKLTPAVVNISTSQRVTGRSRQVPVPQFPPGSPFEELFKDFFERQRPGGNGENNEDNNRSRRRVSSLGSGFVVDPSGIVITNNHVIAEADEITVVFSDKKRRTAEVLGRDEKTDLAVLKLNLEPEDGELPFVKLGDSDASRVGDWVMAIGNPFGLGGSVTAGIISARSRNINAGPYDDFIQTDASINRGNSGGPLFNMDGEVIGVNTAIFSPSGGSVGIGFAIATNLAKPVIEQLRGYGKVRRGWLGVRIQPVTDEIAESLALDHPRGALVAGVFDPGPAVVAGFEAGDVILKFDGKDVPRVRALPRIVAETDIGKAVEVEVWRKGVMITLNVKIGELKEDEVAALTSGEESERPSVANVEALGMTLSSLSNVLRKKFEIDSDIKGVVITQVNDESAAAEKGIRAGDIIVEVAQEEVNSPNQVLEKVKQANDSNRKSVLLLVQRSGNLRFVALRLEKG